MVRIRLRRVGLKNQPSYRIVIQDSEKPRDGRFLEIVGFYNPRTEPGTLTIDEARVFEWMSKGAMPTESVAQLFKTTGTADRFAPDGRFASGSVYGRASLPYPTADSVAQATSMTQSSPSFSRKKTSPG